ncbi:MAM and LDL-receptor class A domain-containing protein 2 [Holothuria leucospilota]|uniref:MAM and LDL-receptor class A domain-containing protein 2 n=1 Tax=Holothuria leucospilota TaxID=206669 RepID=A0A9Q1BNL7_HOLLE|nr:MAM and LDL-receptor class A domain-containing protein 2 [Holothuria leucospilota]
MASLKKELLSFTFVVLTTILSTEAQTTENPYVPSLVCDFESDICNFTQNSNDEFDWLRHQGGTPSPLTGPPVDHTTGTSTGYYMYAESSLPQNLGDTAVITSPVLLGDSSLCLEFYYYMYGNNVGDLTLYMQFTSSDNMTLLLWSSRGSQFERWHRGLIDLYNTLDPFQISLKATVGNGHQGDIAVDDISISPGSCPVVSMVCDFEDPELCGFGYDGTEDVRFVRRAGETPSSNTGPSSDHTYGNSTGYYIYMETSGIREDMLARIRSPVMASTTGEGNCLILWFHMYGTAVDTLSVYMRSPDDLTTGDPLWSTSGAQGNRWWATEIDLVSDIDFVLVIETRATGDYRGDIAIDDFTITGTVCPGEHVITNSSGVSCTFESREICYYKQDKTDDDDWVWQNRATRDQFSGPDYDHTLGTDLGFYMVYAGNIRKPSQAKARLISPAIPPTQASSCLEFWYHMYGDDVEELNVYVVTVSYTSLPDTPSWTTSGNQGNYWHRATYTIPRKQTQFRVIFEAQNGVKERDDVALDDVMLYASEDCPDFTTNAPPPTTRPELVENVNCDFETDWCGYVQATDDLFDWMRHSGPTSSFGSGPNVDHTTGTADGYYALMDCSNNFLRFDDRARLISPLLQASSSVRCLRFFFYKYSTNSRTQDFLNVYIKEWGHRLGFDPDWSYFGVTPEGEWVEGWVEIPASTEPVNIIFEGSYAFYEYYCDIALDDISVHSNSCPEDPSGPIGFENIDCDFEDEDDPLCGYEQGVLNFQYTDKIDWMVKSGPTYTDGTGPNNDHTYGTAEGHYLYIEASQPQRPNDNAVISSPRLLNSFDHMCLQFYYHMSGKDTGWLRVLQTVDNEETRELTRLSGQQEPDWRPLLVDIPPVRGGMRIGFEGLIGPGIYGDIAIDDIKTVREPCGGFPTEIFCDFELGFDDCRYDFMDNGGLARWTWFDFYSGDGPVEAGSGSYMYTSSSSGQTVASILSSGFKLTTVHCVSFDYYQTGSTSNLQVKLETGTGGEQDLLTLDEPTTQWTHVETSLDIIQDDSGKINFVGTTTSGTIAVDNVKVAVGSCQDVQLPGTDEPSKKPYTGGGSKVGMIVGIIVAVIFVAVVAVGIFFFVYSRRTSSSAHLVYKNNQNDSTITPNYRLSTDPGIANPNYEPSNLTANA